MGNLFKYSTYKYAFHLGSVNITQRRMLPLAALSYYFVLFKWLIGILGMNPVDPPASHSHESAHLFKPNQDRASMPDRQFESMFACKINLPV